MINKVHTGSIHLLHLVVVVVVFGWCANSFATGLFSSTEAEKPNPVFARDRDRITAKLIPRAKSTSVTIEFQVIAGGILDAVKGMDFTTVDRPEVDVKNFKSAVFEIGIRNIARGGSATVALRSDFFTLSTAFYVFNPKRENPWIENAQTENRALPERVRELIVPVQDGGDQDADGSADGHITLIGGPRDSFWGYALGTLFIRFFGIFLVLTILMIGMIVSGRIFKALDRRADAIKAAGPGDHAVPVAVTQPGEASAIETSGKPTHISEATLAAIGAALYLRDNASRAGKSKALVLEPGMTWTIEGRKRIMNDRLMAFNFAGRNKP